ncbi:MAG TPA: hypothetical protein VGC69_04800 [Bordetella sp.]
MGAPYRQFTGMLRMIAALNGLASLMLTAFSLGILGGDVDPPDLSEPLEYFLAGFGACGLALLLIFLTQLWREHRQRLGRTPGGRLGLILAVLAFAGGVAGFGMGCWVSADASADDGQGDGTPTAYTAGKPLVSHLGKKILFYR